MAVLVLALVWVGLFGMWIRSRAQDGDFSDPVGTFNRHLRILENTAPSRFPAANQRRPPSGAIAPYRPAPSVGLNPMSDPRRTQPRSAVNLRRAQSQKRRRDVFFALFAGVLGSLILGLIPGLHVMLYIQAIFDVMMVAYCMLLVRMRSVASEREAKLAYLSGARRERAARAGYAPAPPVGYYGAEPAGYDLGYGYDYGDLAVRRAAN